MIPTHMMINSIKIMTSTPMNRCYTYLLFFTSKNVTSHSEGSQQKNFSYIKNSQKRSEKSLLARDTTSNTMKMILSKMIKNQKEYSTIFANRASALGTLEPTTYAALHQTHRIRKKHHYQFEHNTLYKTSASCSTLRSPM